MLFESNIQDILRLLPSFRIRKAKSEVRELLMQKRRLLTDEEMAEATAQVIEQIEQLEAFQRARTVLIYYPVHHELSVLPLVKRYKHEKTILFPVTHRKSMDACPYAGNENMHYGKFRIPEPTTEPYTGKIDLIIVPGVAFDRKCNRLGQGGGYYDRFIGKHLRSKCIGVGYDFQLVDSVPTSRHDKQLDGIITPSHSILR